MGVFIFRTTGSLFKRLETRTDEEGSTVFKKLGTGGGVRVGGEVEGRGWSVYKIENKGSSSVGTFNSLMQTEVNNY